MNSVAAPIESPARSSARSHVDLAIAGAAIALLWLVLCWHLSSEWSLNEQYNYGWFVPLFAGYLFWLRWEDPPEGRRRKAEGRGQTAFLLSTLAFLLLLLLPLRVFEIGNPDWRPLGWIHAAAVAGLTLIYIWYMGGAPWLRHFAFPILFFFVAVPWVSLVEEPIVQGLMRIVAAAAAEVVSLFGIPAQVQGNLIRLPRGLVGVNEACSGVRSLQTSLMIGLLFGELRRLSILRRVLLVAGGVAIAIVANFFRALFLVWIASAKEIAAVDRWHDTAGYVIVAAVFAGSILLAGWLTRGQKSEDRDQRTEIRSSSFVIGPSSFFAVALAWLVVVEIAAASWYRWHEKNLVARTGWSVSVTESGANFREIKIAEGVRSTLRFSDGREVVWQTNNANAPELSSTNYLFFFRWDAGNSSVVRARAHRPDICLPSAGWEQVADHGVKNYWVDDITLPVRHITFRQPNAHALAHTFFCLQEDKVHPEEARPDLTLTNGVQPDWSLRARTETVKNGVRNLGQQVLEVVILGREPISDDAAEEKFAQIVRERVVAK